MKKQSKKASKEVVKGDKPVTEKKRWTLRDLENRELSFFPVFYTQGLKEGEIKIAGDTEVECKYVEVIMKDPRKNEEMLFRVGFQELFMFVYHVANEELRQNLLLRQKKHITHIPYEVSFKISDAEANARMAKRLIKLPVDEIVMARVRAEAQLVRGSANLENVNAWFKRRAEQNKRSS